MGSPGRSLANNLVGAFRNLPSEILEGLVGQRIGHGIEGAFERMPAPGTPPDMSTNAGTLPPQWQSANDISAQQQLHPDLMKIKKPLVK